MAGEEKQQPEAQPVHEMSREAANLLVAAADSGEPISEAKLREELGVGHDDLMKILDQLREHGRASQVAPGEWSGPEADVRPAAAREGDGGRVVVSVPDGGEPEEDELPMPPASELAGFFEPTLKLNRTAVEAMSAQSLGEVIKATIEGQGNGEEFWLQVTE